jgi:hypothetical protein
MLLQDINIGSAANDGTGDSPRAAGAKINANFEEVAAAIGQQNGAIEQKFAQQDQAISAFLDSAGDQVDEMLEDLASGQFPAGTLAGPSISFSVDPDTGIYRPAADTVAIVTGGVERARFISAGRFIVGGTSGAGKITAFSGAVVATPALGASTGIGFQVSSVSGAFGLTFGGTDAGDQWIQAQRVDGTATAYNLALQPSGGRVGIGTTSPARAFEVRTVGGDPVARFASPGGTSRIELSAHAVSTVDIAMGSTANITSAAPGMIRYDNPTNYMAFLTNGTEKLRVDSAGNVGIGKVAGTKLDVDGPIKPKNYTVATVPSASATGPGSQIYVTNESGGATGAESDGTNWRRYADRAVIS